MLKTQNWILPTCDSFPLIVSHIQTLYLGINWLTNKCEKTVSTLFCTSRYCILLGRTDRTNTKSSLTLLDGRWVSQKGQSLALEACWWYLAKSASFPCELVSLLFVKTLHRGQRSTVILASHGKMIWRLDRRLECCSCQSLLIPNLKYEKDKTAFSIT